MKIIINENQFKKIVGVDGETETLIEQVISPDPANELFVLQQKINDVLSDPKRLAKSLNNTNINVRLVGNDEYELILGDKSYPMRRTARGIHVLVIPPGESIAGGVIPMSIIMPEIEKIPEYKDMVESNPNIKDQLERATVTAELHAGDTSENSYFRFEVKDGKSPTMTREHRKEAVDIRRKYPMGEFFNRQPVYFKFPAPYENTYGVLSVIDVESDVSQITLVPSKKQASGEKRNQKYIAPERFTFRGLGDVFEFGDIGFKDEARVMQELQSFISLLKRFADQYGAPFIEYVQSQNPTVYGYSSRDGDPNQQIQGTYQPCSGYKTRQEYDLCLSTERAKLIAEILNKGLPEFGGVFKYKGVGETDEWGPAWTPENAQTITRDDTAPNRRYLLTPFKQPFYPQQTK